MNNHDKVFQGDPNKGLSYGMNLFYAANSRLPTEKAHGLQIIKMCEQFAKHARVSLIAPKRLNTIAEDPFVYYGVSKSFRIKYLPVLDLVRFGRIGFWIESFTFSLSAFFYSLFTKTDIIYGRDELPLYFLSFLKRNIFWEAHQGRMNFAVKHLLKKAAGVVTISEGLKNFYKDKRNDILVSPDAVDFDEFDISLSKGECVQRLSRYLPPDKKIVLYVGHLYEWKGVDTLLETSHVLKDGVLFVFLGGAEKESIIFKSKTEGLEYIQWVPPRPHQEIPLWLKAADILVLPNSGKYEISRSFTSPLKLFEYMASGTPIIASDLPSIREIVSENEVLFFKPDDVRDLTDKIKYAFGHEGEMRVKAESARKKVQNYTWSKRTESILAFIARRQALLEKSDFWPSLIAGAGIAVLSLPILKNISFLDSIFKTNSNWVYGILALWFSLVSFGAVLGVYIAKIIGRKKPIIFQVAKYGLTGWLNVFLYAGVFNLFSWLTGIASGLAADFFLVIAFVATTINGFFWNKLWTFGTRGGDGLKEYAKFFAVTGVTALLNISLFHLIVTTFGAPAEISKELWANIAIAALIPVSFVGNFFGYKIFVFKKRG